MSIRKVILLVFDSVGVGEMPDAADFQDAGSNTLANTARAVGGLHLPTLQKMGLGNITPVAGVPRTDTPTASWGRLMEASPAKDTVTGHWELAGHVSEKPFAIYPEGFPDEIMTAFEDATGIGTLFNQPASGTVVIEQFGEEHMRSGKLIVYTSADSVFQIAAHEEVVPPAKLYAACEKARDILDAYNVARVIARPFVGKPGSFQRTYNRKDFCMAPPAPTLLDRLTQDGIPVYGVGKIHDIFAGRGVPESIHTEGNADGFEHTLRLDREVTDGLIFVNLVDFDMVYGHRRNPTGYAKALHEADHYTGRLLAQMSDDTALIITADHGCDPTHDEHTDHTREYVPVLFQAAGVPMGLNLGTRSAFTHVAATVAGLLGRTYPIEGKPLY